MYAFQFLTEWKSPWDKVWVQSAEEVLTKTGKNDEEELDHNPTSIFKKKNGDLRLFHSLDLIGELERRWKEIVQDKKFDKKGRLSLREEKYGQGS